MQCEVLYTSRVFLMVRLVSWIAVLTIPTSVALAQSCPANESKVCLSGSCLCIPQLSDEALRMIDQSKGPLLESWLTSSRNEARPEASPIPGNIRDALKGYISDAAMDRARFLVADPGKTGSLNLGDMAILYGDRVNGVGVEAITLIDVIVFRSADAAQHNPKLWAHELTHVQQFLDWGVAEFANRYVVDSVTVEDEANRIETAYTEWAQRKSAE